MSKNIILLTLLLITLSIGQYVTHPQYNQVPQLGNWDYTWMCEIKKDINNDNSEFQSTLKDIKLARLIGNFPVTQYQTPPASAPKHNYFSMKPRCWSDPKIPGRLPYFKHNETINPEYFQTDAPLLKVTYINIQTLVLTWYFSKEKIYADIAAELLHVWFLKNKTFINPHLEYTNLSRSNSRMLHWNYRSTYFPPFSCRYLAT